MIFTIRRVWSGRTTEEEKPCEEAFALDGRWAVQIYSLEELLELRRKVDDELIVGRENGKPSIEIYDGYRE